MGAMATGSADWQPTSTVAGSQAVIPPSTRGVRYTASSAARFAAKVTSASLPPATKSRMSAGRIRAAAASASRTHSKDSAICGNALPSAGPGPPATRHHIPAGTAILPGTGGTVHRRPSRRAARHELLAGPLGGLELRGTGTWAPLAQTEPDALGVHDGIGKVRRSV